MASTMGSYTIATSGMATMQTALSVTTNNISNVDTDGYTRQQSIQSNTSWTTGYSGVEVQEIVQIRDRYVDEKYRTELAEARADDAFLTYASEIESIIGEVSDSGLEDLIDPFFNAWEELAKSPDDASARVNVYETALALTEAINQADEELSDLQTSINTDVASAVDQINALSEHLADMNTQISAKIASGETPTDLLDQRNTVLDELCALTGSSYIESDNGTVSVYFDHALLVSGDTFESISYSVDPQTQTPTITWETSGKEIEPTSGQVEGMLRAGQEGTLEQAKDYLDTLASTISEMVNASHESGYDLEGNTGTAFFVTTDGSDTFTAGNISVNPDLEDSDLIAASSSTASGGNTIALEIAALRDTAGIVEQAEEMVEWIANDISTATNSLETHTLVTEQLETQKTSTMGVSLDEEMANLLVYQQAYNASAQVFQLLDELVDLVINGM